MADIDISGSATSGSTASGTGSATDETSRTDPVVDPTPGDITPGAHGSGTDDGSVDDEGDRTVDHSKDESDTGGTPGSDPVIPSYTPVPEPDAGTLKTRTIYTDEYITDYSAEKLAEYEAAGAIAIAVYDDGTEAQVAWSSVTDPTPQAVQVEMDIAEIAQASNQHFWHDTNGAHVTEVTQDDWNDSSSSDYQSGHNLLMNSLGILLRKALNTLVSISKTAVAFFDGNGNDDTNVVASFGGNGAQIGKSNESHMELDYHSLQLIDKEGDAYFYVSDLRDASGVVTFVESLTVYRATNMYKMVDTTYPVSRIVSITKDGTEIDSSKYAIFSDYKIRFTATTDPVAVDDVVEVTYESTDSAAKAFTVGRRTANSTIGAHSIAVGRDVVASGRYSYAEGYQTVASGEFSHAEGFRSHATGLASHAEGYYTTASGDYAHAGGFQTEARGRYSHAVGNNTHAIGNYAHAEGRYTRAYGEYSHTQGWDTIASSLCQFVIGRYNIEDTDDTYLFIIGNGTHDGNLSNAYAIDWNGYSYHAGEKAYPLYIRSGWTESSDETTLPLVPCFVYNPSNNGLYYCD